jgi:uncharacterized membrane protein
VSATASAMSTRRVGRERAGALLRARGWSLAVWAAMFGWTIVLFAIVRDAFLDFRLGRFDLGNMAQAVWSTTQGRPLEYTQGSTGEQVVRLAMHVDPFLVLLAPLWLVWPSPLALAFAQIVVTSLGALPVFWLGRRHLDSERAAGLLALGYLAYPWPATSAIGAIHPVTFAVSLFVFCIWFLDTGRLVPFAVCGLLAMSTGELMGLPILGLGVWYALARGRRREGGLIALAGAAWTFVAVYFVVRHFAGDSSAYYGFYDEIGGSPQGVARTLFTDPGTVLGALVESHDIVYVVWLGLPLLFLFVLAPGIALVGLPQLLANALSDFRSMTDPRYHSVAAIVPFLIAATVLAVSRVRPGRRVLAAASVLVTSAALALVVGPWPRAVGATPLGGRASLSDEKIAALREALARVPDGAPVTASNDVGAHLSARRRVYSVPVLGDAEWVVVDLDEPWVTRPDSPILTRHPGVVHAFARRLERDPGWTVVLRRDGVVVLHRRDPGAASP